MDVVSTSSLGHAASGQPGLVMDRSSTPETSGVRVSCPDAWQTPLESPVVDDEVPPPQALPLGSSVAKGPQQEHTETPPEAQQATDRPKTTTTGEKSSHAASTWRCGSSSGGGAGELHAGRCDVVSGRQYGFCTYSKPRKLQQCACAAQKAMLASGWRWLWFLPPRQRRSAGTRSLN